MYDVLYLCSFFSHPYVSERTKAREKGGIEGEKRFRGLEILARSGFFVPKLFLLFLFFCHVKPVTFFSSYPSSPHLLKFISPPLDPTVPFHLP